MARARSKKELVEFGENEFDRLFEYVNTFEKENLLDEYVFDNRTIKDILAHLHAWHLLLFDWYEVGMKGEKPEIPAPGFTFKTTPELNEKLYQEYKDLSWKEVSSKLNASHKKVMKIIASHSEAELFTKKRYPWTGSTSMGSYLASPTSSHYVWANDLLKRFLKRLS